MIHPLLTAFTLTSLLGTPQAANAPPGPGLTPLLVAPLDPSIEIYVEELRCETTYTRTTRRTLCRVVRRRRLRPPPTRLPPAPPDPSSAPPAANVPPAPPPAPPPKVRRSPLPSRVDRTRSPLERSVLRLLNRTRKQHGLKALLLDARASRVARAHSRDMCRRQYFSHTNPEGRKPWHRLRAAGLTFRAAGENIAAGQRTPAEVHHAWMTSPGHRHNRMNGRYRRVGIGVHSCAGRLYWTEVFLR